MDIFSLAELESQQEHSGRLYHEFLRVPSMSAGIYTLAPGSTDPQQPHTEDELYYVVRGRAHIRVDQEDSPAEAGSLIFVKAGIEHRFFDIEDELTVLVFFAPAEYSQQAPAI